MSQENPVPIAPFILSIKNHSGNTILMGVIILLMGILAIGSPLIAGYSIALLVGIVLIVGGLGQLVFAIKTGQNITTVLLAALTIIIGAFLLINLNAIIATLTIFLLIYLMVSGIFELVLAIKIRPNKGWGWALTTGLVSVLLGTLIWIQYPLSGAWAIGVLLGIKLVFSGWTLIMLGVTARADSKDFI